MLRYDSGRLDKAERTPTGGIKVNASIARTGIQIYKDATGKVRREYRPPEVVFAADTLASLAGAAVTRLHPREAVTGRNYTALAVGFTETGPARRVTRDAHEFTEASLYVQDAGVIADIDRAPGDPARLVEISAGYECECDENAGTTPEGAHYDARQTRIRYNHVALGPENWARAGNEARLRLDGGEEPPILTPLEQVPMVKIKIDGVEYDEGSPSHVSALNAQVTRLDGAVKSSETALTSAKSTIAEQSGKIAKLETDLAQSRKDAAPEALDARIKVASAFRADMASVLGTDFVFDGKTELEVLCAAADKLAPGKLPADERKDAKTVLSFLTGVRAVTGGKPFDHKTVVKSDGTSDEPDETIESLMAKRYAPKKGA